MKFLGSDGIPRKFLESYCGELLERYYINLLLKITGQLFVHTISLV